MTVEEQTPLLIASRSDSALPAEESSQQLGSASVSQTVMNIAKTCAGTGTLALPYAARQGGVLLHICGLALIAGWNLYSVQRLLDCLSLLPRTCHKRQHPPDGTSTLGQVAWYTCGKYGLLALDIMMVMLLAGIVITYEDAIMSFLKDTPLTSGSLAVDAIGTSILIGLLSVVPDMGYLARASATGLTVLGIAFSVIAWYGDYTSVPKALSWFPMNGMSGVSVWFGCIVFGFGMVPLTYNMQESMAEPQSMMGATIVGLGAVAVAYGLVGIGLLLLYPDIQGDLLQELPQTGIVPTFVRLAMVVVVMVTAPLLVVPCGELIEGKISLYSNAVLSEPALRVTVRLGICVVCSVISVGVPGFVQVLSFVGCFCVALVSFVVPPFLHLVLLWSTESPSPLTDSQKMNRSRLLDLFMLLWGISATIITSIFTLREMKS